MNPPKFVQFIVVSTNLTVDCLQRKKYPTFHKICKADKSFHLLLTNYGRPTDINDVIHTQERWDKLQKSLKLIETIDGIGLSPLGDTK